MRGRIELQVGPGTRAWEVAKRTLVGTYNDGFIHAGNLAYLSMLAIFPFFILGAAVFSAFGEEAERAA
ncbi:MAG: ribonuclease BN, partial [Pseudomonadota bacterium]|nr:ribonuclease BN [Pseudomonadota bacterium]